MSASGMKAIKNRIKSIKSTRQITKAMELVASSRMRRALDRAEKAKPYSKELLEAIRDIDCDTQSPYFTEREGRTLRIIIAGDRGLAGGYNHKLFKSVSINDGDLVLPIGKKTAEYLKDADIYSLDYTRADSIDIDKCRELGELLVRDYAEGKYTSVTLTYTSYKNILTQEPRTIELLPIKVKERQGVRGGTIYEPSEGAVTDKAVPLYITGVLYGAVAEAVAAELSSRRLAMEAATDNADAMLDKLETEYNRARQAAITRELTEIIAGAEKEVTNQL